MLPGWRRKGQGENLRGEAGAAHPQQNDIADTEFLDVASQILQCGSFRTHRIEHSNPAKPIGNDASVLGIVLPETWLARPHLLKGFTGSKAARLFLPGLRQITGRNSL